MTNSMISVIDAVNLILIVVEKLDILAVKNTGKKADLNL